MLLCSCLSNKKCSQSLQTGCRPGVPDALGPWTCSPYAHSLIHPCESLSQSFPHLYYLLHQDYEYTQDTEFMEKDR